MKGPTTAYLPFLCMKCNRRAQEFVVEHVTKHIIEICDCGKLVNRTTGKIASQVIFVVGANEVLMRRIAGEERAKKLTEPHLTEYLDYLDMDLWSIV